MLGAETRVGEREGKNGDEKHHNGSSVATLAAYLALLVSLITLILLVILYNQDRVEQVEQIEAQGQLIEQQSQELRDVRQRYGVLVDRVQTLEDRTDTSREALLNAEIREIESGLQFISGQDLTEGQKQRIRDLFASVDKEIAEPTRVPPYPLEEQEANATLQEGRGAGMQENATTQMDATQQEDEITQWGTSPSQENASIQQEGDATKGMSTVSEGESGAGVQRNATAPQEGDTPGETTTPLKGESGAEAQENATSRQENATLWQEDDITQWENLVTQKGTEAAQEQNTTEPCENATQKDR